jgi:hypothetical protein
VSSFSLRNSDEQRRKYFEFLSYNLLSVFFLNGKLPLPEEKRKSRDAVRSRFIHAQSTDKQNGFQAKHEQEVQNMAALHPALNAVLYNYPANNLPSVFK